MSASDEFPRGTWIATIATSGSTASVTFPALPGVGWVLTDIQADTIAYGTETHQQINVTPGFSVHGVITFDSPTGDVSQSSWSWTGQLKCIPNLAVTVAFAAATPANCEQHLNVQAYPV